jgi:mutator protein MutT
MISAAMAVITRGGQVLVARRAQGAHLAGYWEFPGGKRKRGETWPACLAREVREELGISVRVRSQMAVLRHRYVNREVCLYVFRCAIRAGTPKPLSASMIRWVSLAQLRRLRMPKANQPLIGLLASSSEKGVRHFIHKGV